MTIIELGRNVLRIIVRKNKYKGSESNKKKASSNISFSKDLL